MTETIKITMPLIDAAMVEKIFNEKDDPGFTIVGSKEKHDDHIELELMCRNTIVLWFLAKQVYLEVSHKEKMDEMINNIKKTLV